ncbi:hypothetical protein [Streptomyces filamentosus]|uniref:hypothetical protein n=1 Tax=Streptomyces filamentosus TaxID=67294 RepID=UPI00123B564B|nr:hypothetical protein [Streptomyces filamentosus]KAA6216099.1 hypothetical protein CP979_03430 [Streptomyces filamentosus]
MPGRFGTRRRLEWLQVALAGLGVPVGLGAGVLLTERGAHVGIGLAATALLLMGTATGLTRLDALLERHPAPPSHHRRTPHDGDGRDTDPVL